MKDITEQKYIKYLSIICAILLVFLSGYLVFRQVEKFTLQDDPVLNNIRKKFTTFFDGKNNWKGMLTSLNTKNVMKNINLYKGKTSHTLNKLDVHICMKDENNSYYPENMLCYVLIHELAHVLSKSIGHTEEFYKIFEELLVEFADSGLYDPTLEIITDYCLHGKDN